MFARLRVPVLAQAECPPIREGRSRTDRGRLGNKQQVRSRIGASEARPSVLGSYPVAELI